MSDKCTENIIEFIKDSSRATVTFSQGRYKSRIRKLAERRPEECEIIAVNTDGSICAHVPVSWVKIGPPKSVNENQREQARERMKIFHGKPDTTTREKG